MNIVTILLFFIYMWGFGFTATNWLKNNINPLERNLIRIGIGMGVFVMVGVLMNLVHIPLDWKIFLALSLVYPLMCLYKSVRHNTFKIPKLTLTKTNLTILGAVLIFFVCLSMYAGGAFKYPYLEDDDPWEHANSVKYIAIEKTLNSPDNYEFKYLDPYPPGYNLMMGVLHQTSPSMMWTLKFFNGLMLALGILFF